MQNQFVPFLQRLIKQCSPVFFSHHLCLIPCVAQTDLFYGQIKVIFIVKKRYCLSSMPIWYWTCKLQMSWKTEKEILSILLSLSFINDQAKGHELNFLHMVVNSLSILRLTILRLWSLMTVTHLRYNSGPVWSYNFIDSHLRHEGNSEFFWLS